MPLLVGGNGTRVLQLAATRADIVGFAGFHQVTGTAEVALSHSPRPAWPTGSRWSDRRRGSGSVGSS